MCSSYACTLQLRNHTLAQATRHIDGIPRYTHSQPFQSYPPCTPQHVQHSNPAHGYQCLPPWLMTPGACTLPLAWIRFCTACNVFSKRNRWLLCAQLECGTHGPAFTHCLLFVCTTSTGKSRQKRWSDKNKCHWKADRRNKKSNLSHLQLNELAPGHLSCPRNSVQTKPLDKWKNKKEWETKEVKYQKWFV